MNSAYGNLIDQIGILVAVYYGAVGVACAWAYRKVMFQSIPFFVSAILLPFLAGLFCFWVGYQVIRQAGLVASADVLVIMALGVPLVWLAGRRSRTDFFKRRPVAYTSITSEAPSGAGSARA